MIKIRRVKEFSNPGNTCCSDYVMIPVSHISNMGPEEVSAFVKTQVKMHAEGRKNEIESEDCGPVQYVEVRVIGLCYVYEVEVNGRPLSEGGEA